MLIKLLCLGLDGVALPFVFSLLKCMFADAWLSALGHPTS